MGASGLGWLLEGDLIGVPRRYIASTAIVCAVKLLMAASLYLLLGVGATESFWMDAGRVAPLPQNEVLLLGADEAPRWAYLFLGWDSAWYASVAAHGYQFSDQGFAFMPGLPFLARLLQPLGGVLPALAAVSLVAGILWVPLFESVAEHYVGRRGAFAASLLFALSPFTLLFTTVAYAEGLFLLLTLAAWRLYLEKRYMPASVVAALVALVRIPGALIVIPMAAGLLASRSGGDRRRGVLMGVPAAVAVCLWVGFMWLSTGDPFAVLHNSEWSGMYTLPTWLIGVLPDSGLGALAFPVPFIDVHWLLPACIWGSIVVPPLLVWRLRKVDRRLALYCAAYLAGVLAFGAVASLPRFVAVLFPLWLVLPRRTISKWTLASLITVSVTLSLVLWAGFLGGAFVG